MLHLISTTTPFSHYPHTVCRHRPDIAAKVESYTAAAPDGSTLDVVIPLDANTKLAVIGVEVEHLSTTGGVSGIELCEG